MFKLKKVIWEASESHPISLNEKMLIAKGQLSIPGLCVFLFLLVCKSTDLIQSFIFKCPNESPWGHREFCIGKFGVCIKYSFTEPYLLKLHRIMIHDIICSGFDFCYFVIATLSSKEQDNAWDGVRAEQWSSKQ